MKERASENTQGGCRLDSLLLPALCTSAGATSEREREEDLVASCPTAAAEHISMDSRSVVAERAGISCRNEHVDTFASDKPQTLELIQWRPTSVRVFFILPDELTFHLNEKKPPTMFD